MVVFAPSFCIIILKILCIKVMLQNIKTNPQKDQHKLKKSKNDREKETVQSIFQSKIWKKYYCFQ